MVLSYVAGHDELSQLMQHIGTEKYLLLLVPRLGLANRLRSIADWTAIAAISSRKLLISWEVGRECNARFDDLFSLSEHANIVLLQDAMPATIEGVDAAGAIASRWNVTSSLRYAHDVDMWAAGYSSFILAKQAVVSEIQIVITNYDGILSIENSSCTAYFNSQSQFFSQLILNPSALDFVTAAYDTHFANKVMVGVHYREHDATQDWAVVPPLLGDPTDKAFGEGATIEDFISTMKQIQTAVTYTDIEGNLRSNVRFFIAANSEAAKRQFCEAFPTAIAFSGDHHRESDTGMQLAFYEWLMLSRSALILHTYGSTFADVAARARSIPIVGIWEGKLLHHSSTALPYCGSLDFSRSYGAQQKKSKYKRGLNTDHSELEMVFLPLQYTNTLEEWGLPLSQVLTLGGTPDTALATGRTFD